MSCASLNSSWFLAQIYGTNLFNVFLNIFVLMFFVISPFGISPYWHLRWVNEVYSQSSHVVELVLIIYYNTRLSRIARTCHYYYYGAWHLL